MTRQLSLCVSELPLDAVASPQSYGCVVLTTRDFCSRIVRGCFVNCSAVPVAKMLVNLLYAVLCPLYFYRQKHPVNLLLLGVFTVAISFAVGMTCAFTSGNYCLPTMYSVPNLFLSPLMPPLIVLIHYIYMAIVSHYAISLFVTMYGNWTCECS